MLAGTTVANLSPCDKHFPTNVRTNLCLKFIYPSNVIIQKTTSYNPYDNHHVDVYHAPDTGHKINSLSIDTGYPERLEISLNTYKEQLDNNANVTMIIAFQIKFINFISIM